MKFHFYKYQGAGNDFVLIDNRSALFDRSNTSLVKKICDRRFGIGADGLMLLQNSENGLDFEMVYYNADGNEGSMCGNGGRCIVAFAKFLGIMDSTCVFDAVDGIHEANTYMRGPKEWVSLKMHDVDEVEEASGFYFLDTGSPHYVKVVSNLSELDVPTEGAKIRYSERFKGEGTNVNFMEIRSSGNIKVRTYERGVEDETLACGTGVTACAIVAQIHEKSDVSSYEIEVEGGELKVKYENKAGGFSNIWLDGPADFVFEGEYEI